MPAGIARRLRSPIASNTFLVDVPFGLTTPEVTLQATARDTSGNEGTSIPIPIDIEDADVTPPGTEVTAVAAPGGSATTLVSYQVTEGLDDLDHVDDGHIGIDAMHASGSRNR